MDFMIINASILWFFLRGWGHMLTFNDTSVISSWTSWLFIWICYRYCDSAYWDRVTYDWYIVPHRHGTIQSQTKKESYSKEEDSTPSCISWAWWVSVPGKLISQTQEASYSKKEEDWWGTLPGLSGIWALWLSVPRGTHWSSQWSHCTR